MGEPGSGQRLTPGGLVVDRVCARSGHSCAPYGADGNNGRSVIDRTEGDSVLIRLFGLRRTLKITALFVGGVMLYGCVKGG